DLNKVSAGIVKHSHLYIASRCWLHGENNSHGLQPLIFIINILHLKRGKRNAVLLQRLLEWRHRLVSTRFQQELNAVWIMRRYQSQPTILTQRNSVLFREAQLLGVERESPVLIINKYAGYVYSHIAFPMWTNGRPSAVRV